MEVQVGWSFAMAARSTLSVVTAATAGLSGASTVGSEVGDSASTVGSEGGG